MRTLELERPWSRVLPRSNSVAPGGRRSRRHGQRGQSGQGGFGLIEVLVAVALAGLMILAISTGMVTMLRATGATSRTQQLATALMNTTESVRALPYRACGSTPTPTAARYDLDHKNDPASWKPAAGSGVTATVTKVSYWAGGGPGGFGDFQATCPIGGDQGRQRLTVTVAMAGEPSATGTVVIAEPQLEPNS